MSKRMDEEKVITKRIREYLGWQSLGEAVQENGTVCEYFWRYQTHTVNSEEQLFKRFMTEWELPEWHRNLEDILVVVEKAKLNYEIGKVGRNYYARVKGPVIETQAIDDGFGATLPFALCKAFVEYLDKTQ